MSACAANRRSKLLDRLDRLPVDLLDDVAWLKAGASRTSVGIHVLHDHALRVLRQVELLGTFRGERSHRDAERRFVLGRCRVALAALGVLLAVASTRVTGTSRLVPSRTMATVVLVPGVVSATRFRSEFRSFTGWPLNASMTSPCLSPARSAALPGSTAATITPPASFRPRLAAMSDVTGWMVTPSCERCTIPSVRSWSTTWRAMFAGIAKPIPMFSPFSRYSTDSRPVRPSC